MIVRLDCGWVVAYDVSQAPYIRVFDIQNKVSASTSSAYFRLKYGRIQSNSQNSTDKLGYNIGIYM